MMWLLAVELFLAGFLSLGFVLCHQQVQRAKRLLRKTDDLLDELKDLAIRVRYRHELTKRLWRAYVRRQRRGF